MVREEGHMRRSVDDGQPRLKKLREVMLTSIAGRVPQSPKQIDFSW